MPVSTHGWVPFNEFLLDLRRRLIENMKMVLGDAEVTSTNQGPPDWCIILWLLNDIGNNGRRQFEFLIENTGTKGVVTYIWEFVAIRAVYGQSSKVVPDLSFTHAQANSELCNMSAGWFIVLTKGQLQQAIYEGLRNESDGGLQMSAYPPEDEKWFPYTRELMATCGLDGKYQKAYPSWGGNITELPSARGAVSALLRTLEQSMSPPGEQCWSGLTRSKDVVSKFQPSELMQK